MIAAEGGQRPSVPGILYRRRVLVVHNGVKGEGAGIRADARLRAHGIDVDCLGSDPAAAGDTTIVWYRKGQSGTAERIARAIGGAVDQRENDALAHDVEVRIASFQGVERRVMARTAGGRATP